MSTPLPIPDLSAWTATAYPRSNGFALVNSPDASVEIDNLVPGHQISVHLYMYSYYDCTVLVGNEHQAAPARSWTRIRCTVQADDVLIIRILGSTNIIVNTFEIIDETRLPDTPRPADVLSVQAFFPLIGLNGGRFDYSRWNRDSYTTGHPPRGIGVFDSTRWNGSKFDHPAAVKGWQDVTTNISAITTTRGITSTGAVHAASVGTMTIQAIDDLDPRAMGLSHGTPVKLVHWPSRTTVFTGTITDQQMTIFPPGSAHDYTATLTVSDAVARLANITRHGARSGSYDGSEAWNARINRLMKSAPDVPYTIVAPSMIPMCATVFESSLANHLDAVCASVAGSWHVTRDGAVSITAARPPTAHQYVFTDSSPTRVQANIWSFTAVNLEWRASETISQITATNHASETSDGEHHAVDTEFTVTLPGAHAAWSGTSATVDMTLVRGVEDAARHLLRAGADLPMPRSLALVPAHPKGPVNRGELMAAACLFDPLQTARVDSNGDSYPAIITSITHTITPTSWKTQLTLSPNV